MSKVLIVGANATLARYSIESLSDTHSIVTAGREGCDISCDITQGISIPKGIDVVINFAAGFSEGDDNSIVETMQTNTQGVLHVCQAARAAGVKHVIHISTVFSLLSSESSQHSLYSLTKRQGEEIAEYYCSKNQVPLTILRLPRVYGDEAVFKKGQPFLYKSIEAVANGQEITLHSKRGVERNYIHITDVVEILVRVVSLRKTGMFNCFYPKNTVYRDIIAMIGDVYAMPVKIRVMPEMENLTADDPTPSGLNLYRDIDYQPKITLEEGIRRIKKRGYV